MTDPTDTPTTEPATSLDPEAIAAWIGAQRWYAAKSRAIAGLDVEAGIEVDDDPSLAVVLARARFADPAPAELYQLPLSLLAPEEVGGRPVVAGAGDRVAVDAVADPELARGLLRAMDAGLVVETNGGCLRFATAEPSPGRLPVGEPARPMGVEQSNSSIVFGEHTVLKVFRRLEEGVSPELEMLRFLTERDFSDIATLHGWYAYEDRSTQTTLGVAQRYLGDATDGWKLALEQIRTDPAALLAELGALGRVIAQLHNTLASDPVDPAFAPEPMSAESHARLVVTIDESVARVFSRLPDDARVSPIAGRGLDVRAQLAQRSQIGAGGRLIRTHGDLHLGQTLHHRAGWVIIDFEGEPARPLSERREKTSPLRDVAGMLRSFAYATSAVEILHDHPAPGRFEDRARAMFLTQYFSTIEPSLLPTGETAILDLLAILELEKAIYELQYELDNRPDWLPIPVAGIARLLEAA